jgi:hypothetical protein
VKYLLLIYGNPANWEHPLYLRDPGFLGLPPEEQAAVTRRAEELHAEVGEAGEFVVGAALASPSSARTFRGRDGVPVSTDGPYPETKEQLAGYVVVDCETPERAYEIAARMPDARFTAVEVRPIMDAAGEEM